MYHVAEKFQRIEHSTLLVVSVLPCDCVRSAPGAHEPPKAAKERRTSYAGASGSSTYSHVPNFYLIWQEAKPHCSCKDLCETEVSKCEKQIGVCAASEP